MNLHDLIETRRTWLLAAVDTNDNALTWIFTATTTLEAERALNTLRQACNLGAELYAPRLRELHPHEIRTADSVVDEIEVMFDHLFDEENNE